MPAPGTTGPRSSKYLLFLLNFSKYVCWCRHRALLDLAHARVSSLHCPALICAHYRATQPQKMNSDVFIQRQIYICVISNCPALICAHYRATQPRATYSDILRMYINICHKIYVMVYLTVPPSYALTTVQHNLKQHIQIYISSYICYVIYPTALPSYGSVSAGREKWLFRGYWRLCG